MADMLKTVFSKADPLTFFGGSASAKGDPYTIQMGGGGSAGGGSGISSSSSPSSAGASRSFISSSGTTSAVPANQMLGVPPTVLGSASANPFLTPSHTPPESSLFEETFWATHLLETYTLSLVSSPLVVVETLSEVQFQRKDEEPDTDSELGAYETVHADGVAASQTDASKVPVLNGGVWDNVRDLVESEGEGWTTLAKGHLTSFIYNGLYLFLQPSLEEVINDGLDVYDDTHPATNVLSHMIVGGALSPLELIRTRLIAQTSHHASKRYYGPIHAAASITAEEGGGFGALYATSHLIPSVLLHGLRAFLRVTAHRFIQDELGLNPDFNPTLHKTAVLLFIAAECAITTPFEMARKRIQVQRLRGRRGIAGAAGETPQPFKSSVEMAPKVYGGIWSAIHGIVTDEGGAPRRSRGRSGKKKRERAVSMNTAAAAYGGVGDWQDVYSSASASPPRKTKKAGFWQGFMSLYRGYWARYASEVVKFAFLEIRESEEWGSAPGFRALRTNASRGTRSILPTKLLRRVIVLLLSLIVLSFVISTLTGRKSRDGRRKNANLDADYPYRSEEWRKSQRNPVNLTPEQKRARQQPLFDNATAEALTVHGAGAGGRYFQANGFDFCRQLNGASFDSLAGFQRWGGASVAGLNPPPRSFVHLLDSEARRLAERLRKYKVYNETEVDRFACYMVADGANSFANMTSTRLLHRVDPAKYFGTGVIRSIVPSTTSRIPGPRRKYQFAYMLMLDGEETLAQGVIDLINILDDGSALILIHVDLSSPALHDVVAAYVAERDATVAARLKSTEVANIGNVHMAAQRFDTVWGHGSLVHVQLSGFWELMDLADWDFVINLSGMDYPLRYSREIYRVMSLASHRGKDYIYWWPGEEDTTFAATRITRPHIARKETVMVKDAVTNSWKVVADESPYHPIELGLFFPPFPGFRLCRQQQWMTLTRTFVTHLRHSTEASMALAFMEYTFIPDQTYFCYIAINTPYFAKRVDKHNRRFTKFPSYSQHAALLDYSNTWEIGTDWQMDNPRWLFLRKVDVRTTKGRDLARWAMREHVKKHVFTGGYGDLPGAKWVYKPKARKGTAAG